MGLGLGDWTECFLCTLQGKPILHTGVQPLFHQSPAGDISKWPAPEDHGLLPTVYASLLLGASSLSEGPP